MVPRVSVRPAEPDDAAQVLSWRNDPAAIATSLTGAAVAPDEHARWFARVLEDPERVLLIGETSGDTAVGMCRFDIEGASAEVSISLAPDHRGQGLAGPLLSAAIDSLASRDAVVTTLTAQVRIGNLASIRLFTSAGFAVRSEADGVLSFERSPAFSETDPS